MAVRAVREEGFVVLHDAIDPAHIAVLREHMLVDAAKIAALDQVPYQFKTGHLQQDPPPFPPYLFRDILVNAFAIDVTHALLGDGVKNAFYSGNCCLPNDNRQPLHGDMAPVARTTKSASSTRARSQCAGSRYDGRKRQHRVMAWHTPQYYAHHEQRRY